MDIIYRFENVKAGGKTLNFNVTAPDKEYAMRRAVNFILKKLNKSGKEFTDQRYYLEDNIKNGHTTISVLKKPEQQELNFEFENTFTELYYGILNEEN
jgi:hypothetical protein